MIKINNKQIIAIYRNGTAVEKFIMPWSWNPSELYLGSVAGASYLPDPSDVYGANNLAAFGEGISAVLDEKNGTPVLGPELVTTLPVGPINFAAFGSALQASSLVVGRSYRITLTISNYSSGNLQLGTGDQGNPMNRAITQNTNGTFTAVFVATSTEIRYRADGSGFVGTIAVSFREVPGFHARQASASLRPLLGRMPLVGKRNLLVRSEEFNTSWSVGPPGGVLVTANAISPPAGSVRADKLVASAANTYHYLFQSSGVPNALYTTRCKFKEGEHRYAYLCLTITPGATQGRGVIVDLQTGTITDSRTYGAIISDARVEPLADGWFEIIIEATFTQGTGTVAIQIGSSPVPVPTGYQFAGPVFLGDGVSGVFASAADLTRGISPQYQRVGFAGDVSEAGVPSYPFVRFDLSDDRLDTVLPQAVTGDVVIAGRNGSVIAPHSYAANTTFQLGPTSYTGGTPGILRAIGDVVGWSILDKTLTAAERERLMRFYKRRGAKGLLVPGGPELVANGDFSNGMTGWTVPAGASVVDGQLSITTNSPADVMATTSINVVAGKTYALTFDKISGAAGFGDPDWALNTIGPGFTHVRFGLKPAGRYQVFFVSNVTGAALLSVGNFADGSQAPGGTQTVVVDNISVRELRPEEEW